MSRSAVARTVPSSIGTSYVLPVRLSVIVSESDAVATPPPFVLCSSVPISLLGWEGVQDCSLHCGGGPQALSQAVTNVTATSAMQTTTSSVATPREGGNVSCRATPMAESPSAKATSATAKM